MAGGWKTHQSAKNKADASGSRFHTNTMMAINRQAKSLDNTNSLVHSATLPTSAVINVYGFDPYYADQSTTFNEVLRDWVFEDRGAFTLVFYNSGSYKLPLFGKGGDKIIHLIWTSRPQDQQPPVVTDGKITVTLYVTIPSSRPGEGHWRF